MKISNILNIIKRDFRSLTSSAVSIVILIGLILLPCLYAWFNILSNWDPYEPEQTGRIAFAVVNDDKGTDMLGLNINVGEKVIDALEANDTLGWRFVDSKKAALKGVRSGDYYAAIVIPEDFSTSALSFASGDLEHPKLYYYENLKKNAIMPKITTTAKSVLDHEINSAFISTIGKYASEAATAAEAAGADPSDVFGDFAGNMDTLGDKLDECITLINAASSMSTAANELISASDSLISNSQDALSAGEDLLDAAEDTIPDGSDSASATEAVSKLCSAILSDLGTIEGDLSSVKSDMTAYNKFIDSKLDKRINRVSKIKDKTDNIVKTLKKLGLTNLSSRFSALSDKLQNIYNKLDSLEKANDGTWADTQKIIDDLLDDIDSAESKTKSIASDTGAELDDKINSAISDTQSAIAKARSSLTGTYGKLESLSSALSGSENTLGTLDGGVTKTLKLLTTMQNGFYSIAGIFNELSDSEELKDLNALLVDKSDVIGENLASPVKMRTEVLYPTDHYGSIMSPFYTSLALWVGALFTAIFVKAEAKRREGDAKLGIRELFFGRYRVYLLIGLAQAVIVALGDLFYCGIGCEHKLLFFIAVCITGITFSTINFALRFAFDKTGLIISVIFILLQVGGSGGTYPIQLLPPVFRTLYPLMPFHYSMDAMRETVAGMYGNTYIHCLAALLTIAAIFIALGLLLYKPAHIAMKKMVDNLKKCELMQH